ncbi:MAG: hypothetical protein KF687_07285 [Cyclobacteriaceae bacterium]|nr:hypothetical protein [Cyclobacteriaceae bacterium]
MPYFFLGITLNVVLFHPLETMSNKVYLSVQDPINSIVEFIVEVCLDAEDNHPGDERESESDHFQHFIKLFGNENRVVISGSIIESEITTFNARTPLVLSVFISINNPPPEA